MRWVVKASNGATVVQFALCLQVRFMRLLRILEPSQAARFPIHCDVRSDGAVTAVKRTLSCKIGGSHAVVLQ